MAFFATDLQGTVERLNNAGLEYRERTVPSLLLHQVFIEEPSEITIESNLPAEEAAMRDAAIGTSIPV